MVWSFFRFATGICGQFFLSLPQGICVQSLSFTAFSAVGIRVRLFVFALLALVSGYQCISQRVSCCALAARQLHPWRFELVFFPSRLPCGQPYKFRFEANPIWYSAIKFTKSRHSTKCSLHKWAWLRRSIKVSSFELYKFDLFSPHSGSIPRELVHSYALGCLWVVTVLLQHSRPACLELFVDHTHTHSVNNLRWQLH